MKFCEKCGDEIDGTKDGENRCRACDEAETGARKGARAARKERHQALLDCGLVRVRGALGGVYYE